MIGATGRSGGVDLALGEGVPGAAIDVHLPGGSGLGHLGLEGGTLFVPDVRVVGARANQDLCPDITEARSRACRESTVKRRDPSAAASQSAASG
jgi:hypothetical protein